MRAIEQALADQAIEVTTVTLDDAGPGRRFQRPLGSPVQEESGKRIYFSKQTEFYKFSRPLARWLEGAVDGFDVVHVHALFSYPSVVAAKIARRRRVPYVVRPLGVLNTFGLQKRRPLLKRLSLRWIERGLLRSASRVQFTSAQEMREAAAVGVTCQPCIIPIGIDLDAFAGDRDGSEFLHRWPMAADKEIVLFLSRLDPIKGLDLLIPAFQSLANRRPRLLLVIAGAGDPGFTGEMARRVRRSGLETRVLFTGHLKGAIKISALRAAQVFVLPSYSENFGIAAVEALAAGVPVVLTRGVAVSEDAAKAGAALVVEPRVEDLRAALSSVLEDKALAESLAERGRRLARNRYSLDAMGSALSDLYREICLERVRAQ